MLIMQVKEAEQEAAKVHAVFPCILKILPTCVFNKKDPIVLGVDIIDGIAKVQACIHTHANRKTGWYFRPPELSLASLILITRQSEWA